MKLYTEEQVKESFKSGFRLAMETDGGFKEGQEEFINSLTPIEELPSDEKIYELMNIIPFSKHIGDEPFNNGQRKGFELGIKYIRHQILNQNK
jgi:hypothetical protein